MYLQVNRLTCANFTAWPPWVYKQYDVVSSISLAFTRIAVYENKLSNIDSCVYIQLLCIKKKAVSVVEIVQHYEEFKPLMTDNEFAE